LDHKEFLLNRDMSVTDVPRWDGCGIDNVYCSSCDGWRSGYGGSCSSRIRYVGRGRTYLVGFASVVHGTPPFPSVCDTFSEDQK